VLLADRFQISREFAGLKHQASSVCRISTIVSAPVMPIVPTTILVA